MSSRTEKHEADAIDSAQSVRRRLATLKAAGFAALLFLVAFPRASLVAGPFDHTPHGERGARYALAAAGSLESSPPELARAAAHDLSLPALSVCTSALHILRPRDWTPDATGTPLGAETPIRLPFLLMQIIAAVALAYSLERSHGPGLAMLALSAWAVIPLGILDSVTPGARGPALAGSLLALAGMASGSSLRALPGALLAAVFDPAALWIAAPGALVLSRERRFLDPGFLAITTGLVLGSLLAPRTDPALSGLEIQDLGTGIVVAAVTGILARSLRAASPRIRARLQPLEIGGATARVELVVPIASGSAMAASLGAEPAYLLPAIAAGFAAALAQISRPLFALRAGLAPLVALVTLAALPALANLERTLEAGGGTDAYEAGRSRAGGSYALDPPPDGTEKPEGGSWSEMFYAWDGSGG